MSIYFFPHIFMYVIFSFISHQNLVLDFWYIVEEDITFSGIMDFVITKLLCKHSLLVIIIILKLLP